MIIRYLGHSCFLLITESGQRLLTDPFTGVGYPMPKVKAEYVLCSHSHFDHGYTEGVEGVREVFQRAGSYERSGIKITGISSFHDDAKGAKRGKNVIFRIEADGVTVCHMGDIGEPVSEKLLAEIGRPEVLMIPVGGTYTIDAAGAMEYIRALQPRAVLPMHYKTKSCSLDIAPLEKFLELAEKKNCIEADALDTACIEGYRGKIILLRRKFDE